MCESKFHSNVFFVKYSILEKNNNVFLNAALKSES